VQLAVPLTALVVALGWLPILIRFLRAWRERSNPISFAICVLILMALYVPPYIASMLPSSWPVAAIVTIDFIACATFYAALYRAARRFPSTRASARN
jgi:hypothetical protein